MDAVVTPVEETISCDDFLQFTKLLNIWRKSDDRVRHELNALLPTASFQTKTDYEKICGNFLTKMITDHEKRNSAIKRCVVTSTRRLDELTQAQETADESAKHRLVRAVRKQQLLLRQFQTELLEEEVIQTSATKVIYERCRNHYNHPLFDRFR
ncbi:hypothetical protein P879_05123 [Paragonimus westermani]|uniref:Protein MIX23 n=1 Tax=Paragonimus westermani TaxID=34504 RepID=A0A8T0DVG8_9TREM|nr:hypothetical protein P879_05123 [Paragonimus westermani]